MNKYYIYCHENKINGKKYIGQSCQPPSKRWNSGYGYMHCPRFYSAIQHYGWNNFIHTILEDNLSAQEANEREKYYINLYNTLNPEVGYNLTEGGNSLSEYWKKEDNRKIQSERRKEYFQLNPDKKIENDKRISKISRETAKQRSELMKENYLLKQGSLYEINQRRKKKIICVETQEHFESLTEASKKYNICVGSISRVIHGKQKTAGGYHWQESMN